MADYSDMPPLVDGPSYFNSGFSMPNSPPQRRAYASTPYPTSPPSMSSSSPPWPNTGDPAASWGAFNTNQRPSSPQLGWGTPAQPTQATFAAWPSAVPMGVVANPIYSAPVNPNVSYQADGWPSHTDGQFDRTADTAEWAAMTSAASSSTWKAEADGFPPRASGGARLTRAASSSRSLTPYTQSSSQTSSPSSGSIGSLSYSSGRSRSVQLEEALKRPPREWRADFSMARSSGFGLGQLGSLFSLPTRRSSFSRSGTLTLFLIHFDHFSSA